MKRLLSIVMAVLLLAALAACGSSAQTVSESQKEPANIENAAEPEITSANSSAASEAPSQTVSDDTNDTTATHSDVLVAYFSATGTTKGVAEKLAAITGGELYEIVPAQPYSDADLNWNDRNSRSTKEQNDKSVRPEIGSDNISFDGYTTIYLGFPIWWGEEPRILDTFVEKYSFDGITVIPFCTSSSSGIGRSGPNMEALAGSGTWLDGKRFGGAIKNVGIGISSPSGKVYVHTAGTKTSGSIWYNDQDAWLEALAEMVSGFSGHVGKEHFIYINVMNRLSVDCDCDGHPAEPDIHDIGILASTDPTALDQACVDLIYQAEGNASLVRRMESLHAVHTLEHAEELGLGSRTYQLVNIDG